MLKHIKTQYQKVNLFEDTMKRPSYLPSSNKNPQVPQILIPVYSYVTPKGPLSLRECKDTIGLSTILLRVSMTITSSKDYWKIFSTQNNEVALIITGKGTGRSTSKRSQVRESRRGITQLGLRKLFTGKKYCGFHQDWFGFNYV